MAWVFSRLHAVNGMKLPDLFSQNNLCTWFCTVVNLCLNAEKNEDSKMRMIPIQAESPPLRSLQVQGQTYRYHVMIKPTGAQCNLDCSYCFYLHKQDMLQQPKVPRMSESMLELHIKQYIEAQTGNEVVFSWQGGDGSCCEAPHPGYVGVRRQEPCHRRCERGSEACRQANCLRKAAQRWADLRCA